MSDDTPTNVVSLADARAARACGEDEVAEEFDASTLCCVMDHGPEAFIAVMPAPLVDGEACGHALDPEDAEALGIALIRAAGRVRELRGDE